MISSVCFFFKGASTQLFVVQLVPIVLVALACFLRSIKIYIYIINNNIYIIYIYIYTYIYIHTHTSFHLLSHLALLGMLNFPVGTTELTRPGCQVAVGVRCVSCLVVSCCARSFTPVHAMAAMGRRFRVSLWRIVSLGCCLSTGTMGFEDGTDAFSADFFNATVEGPGPRHEAKQPNGWCLWMSRCWKLGSNG